MCAMDDDSSTSSFSGSQREVRPKAGGVSNQEERDIRAALHFAVGRICREEQDDESGRENAPRMSSRAIAALTELTYQYATTSLASDLVCFSKHANRRTINVDDVKLVARKNPERLLASLERFCDASGGSKHSSASSRRVRGRSCNAVASGRQNCGHGNSSSKLITDVFPNRVANKKTILEDETLQTMGLEEQRDHLLKQAESSSSSNHFESSEHEFGLESSDDDMETTARNKQGLKVLGRKSRTAGKGALKESATSKQGTARTIRSSTRIMMDNLSDDDETSSGSAKSSREADQNASCSGSVRASNQVIDLAGDY